MSYCEFAKASARRLRHDEMGSEGLKHFCPVTMPTLVPAGRANWNLWINQRAEMEISWHVKLELAAARMPGAGGRHPSAARAARLPDRNR